MKEILKVICKKIEMICTYLREHYFYCVWCAATYRDEDEFKANCPGPSEEDHE